MPHNGLVNRREENNRSENGEDCRLSDKHSENFAALLLNIRIESDQQLFEERFQEHGLL